MTDVSVSDNPDQFRYEVRLDGELGGFAEYKLADGVVTFTHTEVAIEGKGLGSKLVRHALEDVRAKGLTVVAQCPFVRGYLEKHPELIEATDK
ncbi:putative GNAT family acetyltransferase [Saccharothrix ecbatanensis]|uniref:Putative GNAT family acetyltransferase n=1 Tax=Saccharothrix ecbatanensis TaxID=1105145 RepID=A0A7W9HGV8_9PSEU|nr:GNAT family N-acetyltransferase [Saccharothrix ecbatanensis]MBB5801726.1 putative GNAT family acetyltransferase [Saccharothrix ecbatanensis]